ncbi:MAG: class I SAM-dependent methyltransferase, partial [Bacteroidales bacterium]|nr:class I SAM-dependent methyltransferase [Bacteroidales bacterium]
VECGVFKGASLARFVHFREIFALTEEKMVVGFDTFDLFPESTYEPDNDLLGKFIESAGSSSIGKKQLEEVLRQKGVFRNISLVEGDVTTTIPEFIKANPGMKISLLNLDVDLYEPSLVILENLYPLMSPGGILLLDDYDKFPGETKAVDEYFRGRKMKIHRFPYVKSPCYIIKE